MRKLASILLSGMLALSLCACGGSPADVASSQDAITKWLSDCSYASSPTSDIQS